jgi:hypothetical protein
MVAGTADQLQKKKLSRKEYKARSKAKKQALQQALALEAGSAMQSEADNKAAAKEAGAVVLRLPAAACTVLFRFARDAWKGGRGKSGASPPAFVCAD